MTSDNVTKLSDSHRFRVERVEWIKAQVEEGNFSIAHVHLKEPPELLMFLVCETEPQTAYDKASAYISTRFEDRLQSMFIQPQALYSLGVSLLNIGAVIPTWNLRGMTDADRQDIERGYRALQAALRRHVEAFSTTGIDERKLIEEVELEGVNAAQLIVDVWVEDQILTRADGGDGPLLTPGPEYPRRSHKGDSEGV